MKAWTSRLALILMAAAMLVLAGGSAAAQTAPTVDDWSQFSWRWIGPVNFSGRITEFAVPRGQTTTYYVLTASGGLWKTEDAGTHFEPIFDKYGNMSMGYLAIAPTDPKILYLGTGEAMHARSSSHGNGVWKSAGRREDLGQDRTGEKLLHPQDRGRPQESRHRLRRGRGQAVRQRPGLRARAL